MSGIAGIVNLDGAPIDRDLLDRIASFLAYRGPDGRGIWTRGNVGLVHTLLHTTAESSREKQPASLDGELWITADARLDARDDLIAALRGRGCDLAVDPTEPELLLHAYAAWGEECVEHLLGDFAFAIWDARERKLFCARDHFGVKPFFYAKLGNALVFSNTIDGPRLHPEFHWELYEPAIADFLVIGYNHDVERTSIEAIRRLAPAHALIARDGEIRTRRYWTLPADAETVFRRSEDYVARFRELFERSVRDRLRTHRAALFMSGGLDSSSVAAMAQKVLAEQGGEFEITGHTGIYERLIPYHEAHYASQAAKALGIAWHGFPLDDNKLLDLWDRPEIRCAEPEMLRIFSWTFADLLNHPRPGTVVLTGQGGDVVFGSYRKQYCRRLIRQERWWRLAKDLSQYLMSEGRLHRLYLLGHVRRRVGMGPPRRPFPPWLNPELASRVDLRERYERYEAPVTGNPAPEAAVRPEAYEGLTQPLWPRIFEEYDPDFIGAPVESRHPFFDLRLVRYVLSLPALPWCSDKELLRRSMRGFLPEEIRLRRKERVPADHLRAHHRNSPKQWLEAFEPVPELSRFVDIGLAKQYLREPREWETVVHLRSVCLNYWLKWESEFSYNMAKEESSVKAHEGAI